MHSNWGSSTYRIRVGEQVRKRIQNHCVSFYHLRLTTNMPRSLIVFPFFIFLRGSAAFSCAALSDCAPTASETLPASINLLSLSVPSGVILTCTNNAGCSVCIQGALIVQGKITADSSVTDAAGAGLSLTADSVDLSGTVSGVGYLVPVSLSGLSTVYISGTLSGGRVSIHCLGAVTLVTGVVNAVGRGSTGGTGAGGNAVANGNCADCACSGGGGGAGHAGKGAGASEYASTGWSGAAGTTYGTASAPTTVGSAGGDSTSPTLGGTAGGGSVFIEALSLSLDSTSIVEVDGADSTAVQPSPCNWVPVSAGAGSGGSILVQAQSVSGSGTFSATGGSTKACSEGGPGGGGYITLQCPSLSTSIQKTVAAGTKTLAATYYSCGSGCCGGGELWGGGTKAQAGVYTRITTVVLPTVSFCYPSDSPTPTQTPSLSGTVSVTGSDTPSGTPTYTTSPSASSTPSGTFTATSSNSVTRTPSISGTPSGTLTGTETRTPTATSTPTQSGSHSNSPLPTPTPTPPPCPAATFGSPATSCAPCPGGYFCPPGTTARYANPCMAGNFCPPGSPLPLPCPPMGFVDATLGLANGPAFDVDTAACLNHCFFGSDGQLSAC